MHPIQSHILKKLTLSKSSRYSEIKPSGVESNKFSYHLRTLLDSGMVERLTLGYQLTPRGKRYVDKMSLQSFYPRSQPKIVTVIICKNTVGECLLFKYKKQPFYDLYGFPSGKIHFGETIIEAANRELKEKTGLSAKLSHRGNVYLSVRERGEIISHMLCHVFSASQPTGRLMENSPVGSCQWSPIEKIAKSSFAPGFLNIYKLASSEKHFFEEIIV